MTPVANNGYNIRLLTPQSEIEEKNIFMCWLWSTQLSKQNIKTFLVEDFFLFATGVIDTGPSWAANMSTTFQKKIGNGPNGILRGLGKTDSWKKLEFENLVTLSLLWGGSTVYKETLGKRKRFTKNIREWSEWSVYGRGVQIDIGTKSGKKLYQSSFWKQEMNNTLKSRKTLSEYRSKREEKMVKREEKE